MILDFDYVYNKYNLNVSGIIHIGGHYGGEIGIYKSHNVNDIVLFEPLTSNFSVLNNVVKNTKGNIVAHQVALGNDNRKVTMNISSNEAQSSSILTPKVHLTAHPEVNFSGTEEVEMRKLDDYNYQDYNMMVVDVQGYELEVLKGSSNTLKNIDYIYCEVNCDEVYEDNARVEEIDEFLSSYGFERVETQWYYTGVWGDALYIKNKLNNFPTVYYTSLEESLDRQKNITEQFRKYGITPIPIISKRFAESDDIVTGKYLHQLNDGTKGCCVSHLKAIKEWYETTNEGYAFFCEDDLSLETVEHWNFTWSEFVSNLPSDWDCIQLLPIRGDYLEIKLRERLWDDWSVTAYILTRSYAKKIIDIFCIGDTYNLELPNQDIMPLIENIIYSSGKTYTIPLFVECVNFGSTFSSEDDTDVKNGQKNNHYYSQEFLSNWWRTQGIICNIETLMNNQKTKLEKLLTNYALDPENPETNFALGLWYEKEGHTAPALSYFLRCAERDEDVDIQYLALIKCYYCYDRQGTRDGTAKSLLLQAISILPKRPEAQFLLCKFYEKRSDWSECYGRASLALEICDFDCEPLLVDVEYPGKYGLLFEKAISGWWWGKGDESRKIFQDLKNNYDLDEMHYKSVSDNLMRLASNAPEHLIKYDKSRYEKVRYKFDGLETIEQNYSQIFQDMFILAILNGKKNGTYLEIGAQQPFYQSNTALLETKFGWKGVSIEIKEDLCKMFEEQRKNAILCKDATQINYNKLLKEYNTNVIDYLQVDIEPSKTTFEALLSIPFDEYKFAIVTYEHDHYVDITNSYRSKSRRYMELMGYELVVANASANDFCPFEDWWVHPDLVDKETIEKFKSIQDVTDVATYIYTP